MSKVSGRPFGEVLLAESPGDRGELLRSLGTAIRTLHDASMPTPLSGQEPWLSRMLIKAETHLEWCDGSANLLEAMKRDIPVQAQETLIYGDLALDNVLLDETGAVGFVDWSGGDSGDPRFDLTLALDSDEDLDFTGAEIDAFFSTYGGRPLDPRNKVWFMNLWEFF